MSVAAARSIREDVLLRTTLRIGAGLSDACLAAVVHALQRVPGVLTVDADADNAQVFVAHDAAVPTAALVGAVHQSGSVAKAIAAPGKVRVSPEPAGTPSSVQRRSLLAVVGFAAVLAMIVIDIALANSPERRWLFIIPFAVLWAFALLRTTLARRS